MKRTLLFALAFALTACLASPENAAPASSEQPTLTPPSNAASDEIAQPVWTAKLSAPVNASPVLSGALIIVPTADGKIHAVRAEDGTLAWSYSESKAWDASVNAGEEKVCAGAEGKRVFCLDAQSGALLWSVPLEFEVQSRLALDGERIYAPTTLAGAGMQPDFAGKVPLVALNARDGSVLWQAPTDAYILRRPVVFGDWILTGGAHQPADQPAGEVMTALYAFDKNGAPRWAYQSKDGLMRWVETDGERAYFSAATETIYALDLRDGALLWRSDPGYWMQFPALRDGRIFFGSGDEIFHALDSASGREIWSSAIRLSSLNQIGRPVLRGDEIWFHAVTGEVYALNAQTGSQIASFPTGHSARVGGLVFQSFYIFGDAEGNLYAYEIP